MFFFGSDEGSNQKQKFDPMTACFFLKVKVSQGCKTWFVSAQNLNSPKVWM